MRRFQALADGLVSLFAPKVTASAIWITEYRCVPGCGFVKTEKRQCHDGSGYCTDWTTDHCGC